MVSTWFQIRISTMAEFIDVLAGQVSGLRGTNHEPGHSRFCWLQVPKSPLNVPPLSKYMRLWHQQSQTDGKQKPSWSLCGQFMAKNFKNTRESSSPSGNLPHQPMEVGVLSNYTSCAHVCFFNPMFMAGNYTIITIHQPRNHHSAIPCGNNSQAVSSFGDDFLSYFINHSPDRFPQNLLVDKPHENYRIIVISCYIMLYHVISWFSIIYSPTSSWDIHPQCLMVKPTAHLLISWLTLHGDTLRWWLTLCYRKYGDL